MSKRRKAETGTAGPNPDLNGGDDQASGTMPENDPVPCSESVKRSTITIHVPKWLCYSGVFISVLVALTAILVSLVTPEKSSASELMAEVQDRVGKEGVALFTAYDMNHDGYLSVLEFEPLIPHLSNLTATVYVMPKDKFFHYTPQETEELLALHATFQPLHLETMTKEDILTMDFGASNPLYGLKHWEEPNMPSTIFGVSEFKILLPENTQDIALGKPYHILPKLVETSLFSGTPHLSSSRFYPPAPTEDDSLLYRLLGMMHSRPFIAMRFPPRGTVACVRAYNSEYLHIIFRMHAEFQLNEPPTNPFWFTPGQFLGDLVISRNGSHIAYFHMEVPTDKRLNVDMEWLTGTTSDNENGMEVDIGYMPQMEWTATSVSHMPAIKNENAEQEDIPETMPEAVKKPEDFVWDSVITREDALRLIEIEFYPFKVVTYHNISTAYQLSKEQNKPIHAVVLWGALDDQSC